MALQSDKTKFVRLLRKNPQRTAPALPKTDLTVAKLHRYKERLRAFDAARLELNLTSPAKVQRENSAVRAAFLREQPVIGRKIGTIILICGFVPILA